MNRVLSALAAVLFLSVLVLSGCNDGEEQAKSQGSVTAEDVKEEAVETMRTAKAFTQQQKEAYQRKVDEELNALDRKLNELEAKAESMSEDAKVQYEKMVLSLKQKQKEAADAFEELKQESGDTWNAMKSKMDLMMQNLKTAFDQTEAQS